MKKILISKIREVLSNKCVIIGNSSDAYFANAKPIHEATHDSIVWINSARNDKDLLIKSTKARIIICDKSINIEENEKKIKCFVIVENPKLAFTKIIKTVFPEPKKYTIHPTAITHPEASIHPETYIGPNCVIGKASIEKGSVIHGNCFIYDNVFIGKNVIIQPSVVIGGDGFGYILNENGDWENFPHLGGVIIHDNVEIGSQTSIMRGALGNTEIGEGTKIDCHVQVGHNVQIGRNTLVIANSVIGGSSIVGDNVWISFGVVINDSLRIGNNATIGMGSIIIQDVPEHAKTSGRSATILPQSMWNK